MLQASDEITGAQISAVTHPPPPHHGNLTRQGSHAFGIREHDEACRHRPADLSRWPRAGWERFLMGGEETVLS